MNRELYVEQDGQVVDQVKKDKKIVKRNLIIAGIIIAFVIFFFVIRGVMQSNYCNKIIKEITNASLKYGKDKNILPLEEGNYSTISLDTLLQDKYITESAVTVSKKVAKGSIKITRYKKEYIVTVELTDCDYCDSSKKKWSSEATKKSNSAVVDVIAYYNYKTKTTNYTNWTNWITNDKLSKDITKKYGIRLPLEESSLPVIPKDSVIDTIEQETLDYYRYRDKKWKYYSNGGEYTDYFSSEQPSGYANKDQNTMIYTSWSEYALNYPEKKSYRTIAPAIGYKWYYKEKSGKKVYYKNGIYAVEALDNAHKYTRDTKGGKANMYRYRDMQWRWYNGAKRKYSSYSFYTPKGYPLRDDSLMIITDWTDWSVTSKASPETAYYREEQTDTRYRYRIKYDVLSLPVLSQSVPKDKITEILKQSIGEILNRQDIAVEITYKFRKK